jgi:3-hydroxybenzoate 6-monooxygenase
VVDSDVIVVGGGIGGMGTALALARSGLRVLVLERATEFREVGAGLQVGPNAVRALDRLGVLDAIYDLAVFPQAGRISDALTGEQLTRIDFQQPMIARFGYPYLVLHRNDVLTTLLDACRAHPNVQLLAGKEVVAMETSPTSVHVACGDGVVHRAKLLVGADGLRSTVRRSIHEDEPVFSGYVAYRGTVPVADLPDEDRVDDVLLWVGPDIHLMQYPVRRGELYNQVAVFHSRRHADGRDDWGTPDELVERFAGTCAAVAKAIPLVAQARAYPNWDKDPIDTFVAERTVLIGDAAHPMLQYLGQGACQALEDGLTLAAVLGGSVDSPQAALERYDELRVPRTTRCQRVARPWGRAWHTADPMAIALRNRFFQTRRSDDYSDVAWLYDDATLPLTNG